MFTWFMLAFVEKHYKLSYFSGILDQISICDPVVLDSICYRTRAKQPINNSKTTVGLRKIWTGSSKTQTTQEQALIQVLTMLNESIVFR